MKTSLAFLCCFFALLATTYSWCSEYTPCENGGTCSNSTCVCLPGFGGETCANITCNGGNLIAPNQCNCTRDNTGLNCLQCANSNACSSGKVCDKSYGFMRNSAGRIVNQEKHLDCDVNDDLIRNFFTRITVDCSVTDYAQGGDCHMHFFKNVSASGDLAQLGYCHLYQCSDYSFNTTNPQVQCLTSSCNGTDATDPFTKYIFENMRGRSSLTCDSTGNCTFNHYDYPGLITTTCSSGSCVERTFDNTLVKLQTLPYPFPSATCYSAALNADNSGVILLYNYTHWKVHQFYADNYTGEVKLSVSMVPPPFMSISNVVGEPFKFRGATYFFVTGAQYALLSVRTNPLDIRFIPLTGYQKTSPIGTSLVDEARGKIYFTSGSTLFVFDLIAKFMLAQLELPGIGDAKAMAQQDTLVYIGGAEGLIYKIDIVNLKIIDRTIVGTEKTVLSYAFTFSSDAIAFVDESNEFLYKLSVYNFKQVGKAISLNVRSDEPSSSQIFKSIAFSFRESRSLIFADASNSTSNSTAGNTTAAIYVASISDFDNKAILNSNQEPVAASLINRPSCIVYQDQSGPYNSGFIHAVEQQGKSIQITSYRIVRQTF